MKKEEKFLIIIFVFLVFILAGLFLFYRFKRAEKKSINIHQLPKEKSILPSPSNISVKKQENTTKDWKKYTNEKYGYSFLYPPDYRFGPCQERPCGKFVYDKISKDTEKDYVLIEDTTSKEGWPKISITHYDTSFYNPPKGVNVLDWVRENVPPEYKIPKDINLKIGGTPAVKVIVPKTPDSSSSWFVYFIKDEKLFQIEMVNPESKGAQDFYNLFLSSLKFE